MLARSERMYISVHPNMGKVNGLASPVIKQHLRACVSALLLKVYMVNTLEISLEGGVWKPPSRYKENEGWRKPSFVSTTDLASAVGFGPTVMGPKPIVLPLDYAEIFMRTDQSVRPRNGRYRL